MSGTETLITQLCGASRFVELGLAKFDELTGRLNREAVDAARMSMATDGEPDAEGRIGAFIAEREIRANRCRGELHRDLWSKIHARFLTADALHSHCATDADLLPQGLIGNLVDADRYVWAGLKVADEALAEVAPAHVQSKSRREELRRRLWEKALAFVSVDDVTPAGRS